MNIINYGYPYIQLGICRSIQSRGGIVALPTRDGELKMARASWGPYTARPVGLRDVYTMFGEARPSRCMGMA